MAATSQDTAAWYEEKLASGLPQTFFTKYLVDLVERGIPGQPPWLRLDPLFKQLHENLGADKRPLPRSRAVNDAREFVFARNAAPPETHRDPDREIASLTEQLRAIQAEVAEQTTELERLRIQAADAPDMTTTEQRALRGAINAAERILHDTVAAEAAVAAASSSSDVSKQAEKSRDVMLAAGYMPLPRMLNGRYKLESIVVQASMEDTYKGYDTMLGRMVAIKTVHPDLADNQVLLARFRNSARLMTTLSRHPSMAAIYDIDDDVSAGIPVPFIVMEYVDGRTLREVLNEGPLSPRRTLKIISGVLHALKLCHQSGIVHRNVKPRNVMITKKGTVKLIGYGMAQAMSEVRTSNTVSGTALYLSPEQARGVKTDARSDVYSTGCLMYELLTGRPPFTANSPVAIAYQHIREDPIPPSHLHSVVPPWGDAIVLKALAKSPEHRYQTAAEMNADIECAASGQPVIATLPYATTRGNFTPRLTPESRPNQGTRKEGK